MAKTKKATKGGSKRQKPFPFDEYLAPFLVIGVAVLGYHVFRGMLAKEILRVDITADTGSELELREVLFGEDTATGNNQNYAVLCYPETTMYPISSVFQDAANDGSAPANFRLLDCETPLSFSESSNKSINERFKFNTKTKPVVFVSGSIGTPKQVR